MVKSSLDRTTPKLEVFFKRNVLHVNLCFTRLGYLLTY